MLACAVCGESVRGDEGQVVELQMRAVKEDRKMVSGRSLDVLVIKPSFHVCLRPTACLEAEGRFQTRWNKIASLLMLLMLVQTA